MATLKEEALAYEPQQTLNIADLQEVSVDFEILETEKNDGDGKPFKYKYVELNGKEYRVPASVLEEIQKMLKLKADLKSVKVTKTGSGMATRYKVEAVA